MIEHKFTIPPSNGGYARGCRCRGCLDAALAYQRDYKKKYPERIKKWNDKARKVAQEKNPHRMAEYQRAYRERNPERSAGNQRRYKDAHPDAIKEANRKSQKKHREKINARAIQRRKDGLVKVDLERNREYQKQYRQTERGKNVRRKGFHAYRARKQGAKGYATVEQVQARWDFYGGLCYLCGTTATSIDHVIPLSRGGTNWPANLRPACMPCNTKKRQRKLNELLAA